MPEATGQDGRSGGIEPGVWARDLARRADAAAALLRSNGAAPGRPVAVVSGSATVVAVLAHAAPLLPVPLFPLDPGLPDPAITDLLGQAGVSLVVSDRAFAGQPHVPATEVLACAVGQEASWRAPEGVALLIATSGSSGRPKAVMLTGAALAAAARASAARTPLGPGDAWLACLPLFHIGGFSILTRCALAGANALIHERFDVTRVMAALTDAGVTHLSLVPAMLARLCDFGPPPATLRHVLIGGAALATDLAERAAGLGWPIRPTYGMSETASQVATLPALPHPWRAGHVGAPLQGAEVGLNGDGRLRVRGPMVMAGYANPDLRPGDGLSDGWFVTADLAEIRPDGEITILGRADDVIISAGKKVLPGMVEDLLARCPMVDAVAVAGRPDPVWGELVVAVFTGAGTPDAVLDWCRAEMPSTLRPRAAVKIGALPLLANGKPDRHALRRLAGS
ncbi:class I adenylate-forming enzyme family protein [Rhodospira trueperi]|uniref:O-succinylbenzoic acid--CoA ligase n=1 Tax=Rhodospira trueperi TaxID=69960 RepID=A0A1G7CB26_9PROT|nr:AMP-binding protein [Rhodospira trueperi]SDE36548.1 O-succinylbenzoic acid--CoA ligase [Rhodospira trueperi]